MRSVLPHERNYWSCSFRFPDMLENVKFVRNRPGLPIRLSVSFLNIHVHRIGGVIFQSHFLQFADHHFVTGTSTISSEDIITTIPCGESCDIFPIWTFNTSREKKLRIEFEDFFLSESFEFLEIGYGLTVKNETRLAHFMGTDMPSDVITIGNSAWINVNVSCGNLASAFIITIFSINESGRLSNYINSQVICNKRLNIFDYVNQACSMIIDTCQSKQMLRKPRSH